MAQETRRLSVLLTVDAADDLREIWFWNAKRYGASHGDSYEAFLRDESERLETTYDSGSIVPLRPDFRYVTIRKRRSGHGHVVIYRIDGEQVQLLRVFHTAQDWPSHVFTDPR